MRTKDLKKYCESAVRQYATHAKPILSSTVVTAPWVRLKCQFGCPTYGKRYRCPPDTPTPEQTQAMLDSYRRAILFHQDGVTIPEQNRKKAALKFLDMLVELEGVMFKDGYYKALVFLAGPCYLCNECGKGKGEPCLHSGKSRPAMEACGIDVYQTARNNAFHIQPLRDKAEPWNLFGLMLVD
jgi:predicted metal-binding protein